MRIIAVDDERLALEDLLKTLSQAEPDSILDGFSSPGAALEHIKTHPADVAFVDIEMYGINGLELAKRFKEARPGINIVFVTGYTHYALDAFRLHASGYLLKPATLEDVRNELENLRNKLPETVEPHIRVQTFGNFEVFVDGVPLKFGRTKSKELLAFLVDRKGAGMTTAEICAVLWEDRECTPSLKSQYRNIVADLTQTLKTADALEMIVKKRNQLAVNIATFDCDYYNFLKGDIKAINSYTGEYMTNYSWAEFTTGLLPHFEA